MMSLRERVANLEKRLNRWNGVKLTKHDIEECECKIEALVSHLGMELEFIAGHYELVKKD